MSKNKNQHYVPAFYLYNFTNQTQRAESFGKAKRDTKIYHYDFNKGCVRERPIEKVAIESYLLSYKNSDDVYNHDLDNEIQNVENVASKAISELNDIFLYALKKKPNHVKIKNSVMDSILELLYWQMKRHPDIVTELEKECEQYLLEKEESPQEAKRMAIEVIKNSGRHGQFDIKNELNKKNKIILCTSSEQSHFITTDKPFVRMNKTGGNGIAILGTEMYYPLTSNMLLFMQDNGNRKELRLEKDRKFLREFNTYMARFASNYLFGKSDLYLKRIAKNIGQPGNSAGARQSLAPAEIFV